MIVEISSYPKCGNTWLRYIIAELFQLDIHKGIPDIHQQKEDTKKLIQRPPGYSNVGFYKSHITDNININPDKIFWIYRHPLDVFLSCLNYFYTTNAVDKFLYGSPKPVDDMHLLPEFSYYFEDYLRDLGDNYFKDLLGEYSCYGRYVENAINNPKVFTIKYEDIVDNPKDTLQKLLTSLLPLSNIHIPDTLFIQVDSLTKNTKDPFYWKARKNNFKYYLSDDQIIAFESEWGVLLNKLGY